MRPAKCHPKRKYFAKDKCRQCYYAEYGKTQPTRRRFTKYGLTPEDLEHLLAEHDGRCAICKNPFGPTRSLSVDHDHEHGHVRELLCRQCNCAIGLLGDNPVVVQMAVHYLTYHKRTNKV